VKADLHKPLEYAFVLSTLLAYRMVVWVRPKFKPKKNAPLAVHSVKASEG
jgi:hypothetical protein